MTGTILLAMTLTTGVRAAEPAAPPAAEASASTEAARALTSEDIYWGFRFRDPFSMSSGGGGSAAAEKVAYDPAEFSIHELALKGILKDKTGDFAILVDPRSGAGFILRGGRLYDYKNKRVAGVSGRISAAQKTVVLITPEKDVQTLRLGEQEEDEDAEKPVSASPKKEKAS